MTAGLEMKSRGREEGGEKLYSLDGPKNPKMDLAPYTTSKPACLFAEPNKIWIDVHNQNNRVASMGHKTRLAFQICGRPLRNFSLLCCRMIQIPRITRLLYAPAKNIGR